MASEQKKKKKRKEGGFRRLSLCHPKRRMGRKGKKRGRKRYSHSPMELTPQLKRKKKESQF